VDSLRIFFDAWGNSASVIGLLLTLIGFSLTLYGQWRIKRVAREAIRKVALQLAVADLSKLERLAIGAIRYERQRQWRRVIARCQPAKSLAIRLSRHSALSLEEKERLRDADEDLRLVIQYIEQRRLPPNSGQEGLSRRHKSALNRLQTTVGSILGRLQSELLEV
jgi:hypothetical protein